MSYSQEELEALLQNEDFMHWVLTPGAEGNAYWEQWVRQQPDRRAMVDFIRSIHLAGQPADSRQLADDIWHAVQAGMDAPVRRLGWRRYAAAAAAVVLLGAGGWWYAMSGRSANRGGLLVEKKNEVNIMARNNGAAPKTVYLTDGSRITLGAGSSLEYDNLLESDKRVVYLKGEAFFEVAKDARRPFIVYSDEIVTKVLGTSFRVTGDDRITVAVRSGKVAVSRREQPAAGEMILLPNEQVIFDKKENKLSKTAVADAVLLQNPVAGTAALSFDEAPVTQVLDSLAVMYTVNIQFDRNLLAKCMVTVSLEQEALYDKLQILCKVLGATFETKEHVIYVKAPGCN